MNYTFEIDETKRQILVQKYDLMNFEKRIHPIYTSMDEFFDGNNDDASIAPNLEIKPTVSEYYKTFKNIARDNRCKGILVEIKDVMIYEDGRLNENEWFYTDVIYIIGSFSREEIIQKTAHLKPDEVDFTTEPNIVGLNQNWKTESIIYIWWD